MKYINIIHTIIFFSCLACSSKKNISTAETADTLILERNKEAREDSAKMAEAQVVQGQFKNIVTADVETDPVGAGNRDDAADDPAFWMNKSNPDSSIIFGTNKKGGIYAYNLNGKELAYYPVGKINNIDIRQDVKIGEESYDILGGSNRTDNSVVLYTISSRGKLTALLEQNFIIDTLQIDEVYGFCLYKNNTNGEFSIFVNGKNGRINQYMLAEDRETQGLRLNNYWETKSQPEGMVADDDYGYLYVGEEERGIWKIGVETNNEKEISLIPDSQMENNPAITYDIEGLAIYNDGEGSGFIVASVQGNFSYAMFDRSGENTYLTSFVVKDGLVDGAEETDGLEIYSYPVNDHFPAGLFIAQDGFNYENHELKSQNFKVVDLARLLGLRKK